LEEDRGVGFVSGFELDAPVAESSFCFACVYFFGVLYKDKAVGLLGACFCVCGGVEFDFEFAVVDGFPLVGFDIDPATLIGSAKGAVRATWCTRAVGSHEHPAKQTSNNKKWQPFSNPHRAIPYSIEASTNTTCFLVLPKDRRKDPFFDALNLAWMEKDAMREL
jgi:hypothetical protein